MIVATGIDIVEIARIEAVLTRHGPRFQHRVFTADEIAYCDRRASKYESYAARFAAKEAFMKALGTGWADGVGWQDIEVVRGETGRPSLSLARRALDLVTQLRS